MRGVRLLAAAAAIGAAAVTAACGQQTAAGPGGLASPASGRSPGGTGPAVPPGHAPGCHGAARAPARGTLLLGAGDNGESFCLTQGASVLVILRGSPGGTWAPVRASSAALVPRANGHLTLARWVTGAAFAAARPGTAVLSSMRPVCRGSVPVGAPPSLSPARACAAEQAFRATVVVIGR